MAATGSEQDRDAIVDAVRTCARERLGKPVELVAQTLNVRAGWAFLLAELREPDGRPIDYAGTPLATAAAAGGASRLCAALLSAADGAWTIVDVAIGPGDMAWEAWPDRHGVPGELLALD